MKITLITSNPLITTAMSNELSKIGELVVVNGLKLTKDQVIERAKDTDILIAGSSGIENISDELLGGLPKLKFISTLTVGLAWVDLEACKKHGVIVSNVKGANSESVAEHTWAMILDLAKRVSEFDRDVRSKNSFKFADYVGKEVYGKTIGIIGLGDIGQKVARIANAFDMKIIGLNKSGKQLKNIELVNFEFLLKNSDIISICTPLTTETVGLISDREVALMKDGVIVVNCAMEKIVDKDAIFKGLESGKIFGFGIETEISLPVDPSYLINNRIVVTPHNAFNTVDANIKTYNMAIENVKSYIGNNVQNRVV